MSERSHCPADMGDDLLHRYVAGALSEAEASDFELHFVDCPSCQRAVREGAAIRAALRRRSSAGRRRKQLVSLVPLAAAAVAAFWLLLPSEDAVQRLGRLDAPPSFRGLSVRAATDRARTLADSGMAAYVEGRYPEATRLLDGAARLEPSPGVSFFLGMSRLLDGEAGDALSALNAALDPADNPYELEARYYLAKAWLRLGEADSALGQLEHIPLDAGTIGVRAVALADSVRSHRE